MKSPVLMNVLLVGAGGFAGSVLRYGLSGLVYRQYRRRVSPGALSR
jgi:fluoride ion exporter CrcB/FEX